MGSNFCNVLLYLYACGAMKMANELIEIPEDIVRSVNMGLRGSGFGRASVSKMKHRSFEIALPLHRRNFLHT
jgi:hypothetical protein